MKIKLYIEEKSIKTLADSLNEPIPKIDLNKMNWKEKVEKKFKHIYDYSGKEVVDLDYNDLLDFISETLIETLESLKEEVGNEPKTDISWIEYPISKEQIIYLKGFYRNIRNHNSKIDNLINQLK